MLTAIIILSLLSLLVATEAEPGSAPIPPRADPPLRPAKKITVQQEPEAEKIAA